MVHYDDQIFKDFVKKYTGAMPRHLEHWCWHGSPGFLSTTATVPKMVDFALGYIVLVASEQIQLQSGLISTNSEYIEHLLHWFETHPGYDLRKDFHFHFPSTYNIIIATHTFGQRQTNTSLQKVICECGAEKARIPGHSTWCPKHIK